MDVLPGFDVAEQIDAPDGDKGAAKSFDDKMTNAQRVRDFLHVVNYLKEQVKVCEGGGTNAAAKHKEAFECKTMQQLKDFIEQLPPKIKLRFSNMGPAAFSRVLPQTALGADVWEALSWSRVTMR